MDKYAQQALLEYNNEEYDLIQPNGQSFKRLDKHNSGGYYRFDDEQFEDLILKYVTLPGTTETTETGDGSLSL